MASKDDPRLPSAATRLPTDSADKEEAAPTVYGIAGMVLGLWGLMGRNKIACWAALFACLANIANMKTADFDTKQVLMGLMIAIMGLVTSYNSQETVSIFDLWFGGKK